MGASISQKHNKFTYFCILLGEPDRSQKNVLDFGARV